MTGRIHKVTIAGSCIVVDLQGCSTWCGDCPHPSVRTFFGGEKTDSESIKKQMAEHPEIGTLLFGLGEPFVQTLFVLDLAQFAKARGIKVQCSTGYAWDTILEWMDDRRVLLETIDMLTDGVCSSKALKNREPQVIDVKKSLEKGEMVLYGCE